MKPTPYQLGHAAARRERPTSENPYKAKKQRAEWQRGHDDGEDLDLAQQRHRQAEALVARGDSPIDVLARFAAFYPRYCAELSPESLRVASPPSFDLLRHGADDRHACARCSVDMRLVACDCRPAFGCSESTCPPWLRNVRRSLKPRVPAVGLLGDAGDWYRLRLLCTQGLNFEPSEVRT